MGGEISGNGWNEWKNHVLASLKDNKEDHEKNRSEHLCIVAKLDKIRSDIAALQVKSGVWGLIGGLIPVLIVVTIWAIKYLEIKS